MMVAPPPATPPLCSNLMYTVMYMAFSLTLSPDSRYLDVTEGGALAVCQSLYDHQWRHQLPLLDVLQNLCNVLLALLTREVRQSLHPQVGVFVTERERGGRVEGDRETAAHIHTCSSTHYNTDPCLLHVVMKLV